MKNNSLREYAKQKKVCLWEIAEADGFSYQTMTRKLRHELSETELKKYMSIIDQISKERGD